MVRLLMGIVLVLAVVARADESLHLETALREKRITVTASGNGRDTLHLQVSAPVRVRVEIPAGTQFRAENGDTQLTLRKVAIEPGPASPVDAIIPAAATSLTNSFHERPVTFAGPTDPKLEKLLELFGHQNDLPRATAQLAIFIALADIRWPNWIEWMKPVWSREKSAKDHPTPAEVAQAVDGIAFARLAFRDEKFAILADDGFKRLALRNPWARGKAMALYGMSVEDAITGDASLPVDLGKLLHTSPNDNCPICRQRNKSPAEIP